MIPISDNFPSERTPWVTRSLVVLNVYVFFQEMGMGRELEAFFYQYGLVPAKYTGEWGEPLSLGELAWPFFTSMFLHGGFLHLIGNMLILWIFGDNVEDRVGPINFLIFYIGMGLVAAVAQIVSNPVSSVPIIGASGAVAGVMGAYFVFHPHSRVVLAVPIFIFIDFWEVPAFTFFIFWFLLQFMNGAIGLISESGAFGGVAWWAHIGGFLCGMILALTLFRKPKKKRREPVIVRVD